MAPAEMGEVWVLSIVLIAVSLALDAFAVSVSSGISVPGFGWRQAVKMGLWFGVFQCFMPLLGWSLGSSVSQYIEAVDHWIAFGLLALIGGKMVVEALKQESGGAEEAPADLSARRLCVLALATSIDALAVGVTFAFLRVAIVPAVLLIGATTFMLSAAGVRVGNLFGSRYKSKAELAGGLMLIFMGTKILLEHLGVF